MNNFTRNTLLNVVKRGGKIILMRSSRTKSRQHDTDIFAFNWKDVLKTCMDLGFITLCENEEHIWLANFEEGKKQWSYLDIHKSLRFGDYTVEIPEKEMKYLTCLDDNNLPCFAPEIEQRLYLLHQQYHKFIDCHDKEFALTKLSQQQLQLESVLLIDELCRKAISNATTVNSSRKKVLYGMASRVLKRLRFIFASHTATVVLLGVDGAGKSTLIDALDRCPVEKFDCVYLGPLHSENVDEIFLKRTLWILEQLKELKNIFTPIATLAKIMWHIIIYFTYIKKILLKKLRLTGFRVTVYDRYSYDMFLRYPDKPYLKFYKLVPRPSLIIYLTGDPKKINGRKDELSVGEIIASNERYKNFLSDTHIQNIEIDTTYSSVRSTALKVLKILSDQNYFKP